MLKYAQNQGYATKIKAHAQERVVCSKGLLVSSWNHVWIAPVVHGKLEKT